MDLLKRNDESFLDYAERLIEGLENKIYDLDKAEIYKLLLSEDVTPEKCLLL